jgi:hypothetical protein
LQGIDSAIEQLRGRLDETVREGIAGDLQGSAFEEILAKVKNLAAQIGVVQEGVLAQTRQFIAAFNKDNPSNQIGPGAEALLISQARQIDMTKEFQREARELEDSLSQAYEGFDEHIKAASVATAEEASNTIEQLRAKTAGVFERLDAQAERGFGAVIRHADTVAATFESLFLHIATGGEVSFKRIAQEFGRLALSIALDAFKVRESLAGLFLKGAIGIATALGGGATPAGDTASLGTALGTGGPEAGLFGSLPTRAEGGPVFPGEFYTVGEKGPELLYANSGGRVLPTDALRSRGPVTVNFYGVTDAGSFRRSQSEVTQRIQNAIRAAE